MSADSALFTRPFVVTCPAMFFFYLSFTLMLPVMPLYLAEMGGTSFQIGLIIGPAVGTMIAAGAGFHTLFLVVGTIALIGLACIWLLPRIGQTPAKTTRPPRPQDFFSRPSWH